MQTPSEVVMEFLSCWEKPGGLDDAFRSFFTETTTWENVGWVTTTGPEEAIALNHGYNEKFSMAAIQIEGLILAETGNKVLTERIDHLLDAGGNKLASPAVMGIFEVEGGKIVAWRDYFDTRSFVPPD